MTTPPSLESWRPTVFAPAAPGRPPSAHRTWFTAFLGGLVGAALMVGIVAWTGAFSGDQPVAPTADRVVERPIITSGETVGRVAAVAARAVPSIVAVQIYAVAGQSDTLAGAGSGVIFDENGLILTNSHVIEGAAEIKVSLSDGRTYAADLVGSDPITDIAVLGIGATGLPTIDYAAIDEVEIGDLAVAVGNPLGLEGGPSVTSGVVSAFNRELEVDPFRNIVLYGLLQTDAPITRGSSGGALLNEKGDLLGITTAIGVSDVGAEGLGFAVPVDLVDSIAQDLIVEGQVRHAFLGITGRPAFSDQNGVEVPIGAEITGLTAGSAIGAAGARPGDVIVSLAGERVSSMNLLVSQLRTFRAGQTVDVELIRDGDSIELSLTLDERPEN